MSVSFRSTKAEDVKTGDVLMQVDEGKRRTEFYYYRAYTVFVGELVDEVRDGQGNLLGKRRHDGVEIFWQPFDPNDKPFNMRYHRLAQLDIATSKVESLSDLILSEDHDEE